MGGTDKDVAVFVWGPRADVLTAAEEIRDRVIEALDGVPNETRQARFDGTTDFERVLPGPDRMYPDTDHPPVKVERSRVQTINKNLPEKPWDVESRYQKWNFPKDAIDRLPVSHYKILIDRLAEEVEPEILRVAAITVTQTMKALERKGIATDKIRDDDLIEMFMAYRDKKVSRDDFPELITAQAENIDRPFLDTLKDFTPTPRSPSQKGKGPVRRQKRAAPAPASQASPSPSKDRRG